MIPVTRPELSQALAHLQIHAEGPIFLQSNLRNFGLAGHAPYSVHLRRTQDWCGYLGLTVSGMLLPQMRDAGNRDWRDMRRDLAGVPLTGIVGEAGQVERLQELLGISYIGALTDHREPCFRLDLADLVMPDMDGLTMRPLQDGDRGFLHGWKADYLVETLGHHPDSAAKTAPKVIDRMLCDDSHMLLLQGGRPVSMAGVNASVPGEVQIGGVYTPPRFRGQGFARAAVAQLLRGKRGEGFTRAFLFAASDRAAYAYKAIGFRPDGWMKLVLYLQSVKITE